ncbi:type II CRISPR RNA-guided endonuclease Cas9 [Polaribacter sp. NJDZ03]|uniref:type II CRISPR RNA-guided endonuclease Cas9 n=1 Tax=Polaribacter sp. NJDZ03 TaxID=2855841 RepID=UPI001C49EED5|nr:type II CRISPR RNA-guided endonuclease Cas9 [Polaribacter sp. NJDZ03]
MSKIKLGLDLGTNSIGWAVLKKADKKYNFLEKYDKNNNLIPTKGSYIFPKGVNADENSKAAERRGFRSARVRLQRIILRKIATLKVLNKYGLCPTFEEGELNTWKNKKIYPCENDAFIEWQRTGKKNGKGKVEHLKQPYYLRHLAATKEGLMDFKQGRLQLGRVFYHLAQRRGYLSNSDEEQTEDKLELFKIEVIKLLEEVNDSGAFKDPFDVILNSRKSDKKVKTLGSKINRELKKEIEFKKIKSFIITEFDKPDNQGKVLKAINELSKEIKTAAKKGECAPTMGSYFYSIYTKADKKTGLITKIRGRYTHRNEHYLEEFNIICNKQNINGELRTELHNAIFYQRPLKSQKGLVAKCPLEPKRKRIALSHPLFEEFRMWESINRIKISRSENANLEFLTKEEKEKIKTLFLKVGDFEFRQIASLLSGDKTYSYIKKTKEVFFKKDVKPVEGGVAEIFFNFPIDKKFSACPTTSHLIKVLGKEEYYNYPFLNSGYNDEKEKAQISIEDIWHCLFLDSFGQKDKKQGRADFARKHLVLNEKDIEDFQKIKLVKSYGSLSKAAIKKIIPFLQKGEIYTHAVFLANISDVLGHKLSEKEQVTVTNAVVKSLKEHKVEKQIKGILNNFISLLKNKEENKDVILGEDEYSIEIFKKEFKFELINWLGERQYEKLSKTKQDDIFKDCWNLFYKEALNKLPKEISYLKTETIPNFILNKLQEVFPNDRIDITKLYHPSAMEAYPKAHKKLGNPEISSIKNPVFNRAMHQIKRLCNKLIKEGVVDKDTFVNVEVAGEINSASYRRALSEWQKDQESIRDWAKKEIIKTYPKECQHEINPSDSDVVKYILWKEQNHQCLYTSFKPISICDFLGDKTTYDIEHTVPRSKLHDNSLSNKTLANAEFNRKIKKDILPGLLNVNFNGEQINKASILNNRDANLRSYSIKSNIPNWNVSLSSLKAAYNKFKNAAKAISDPISHSEVMTKAHYTKMKLDYLSAKYKTFETEEIIQRFTNANLVDTRIISKYARAYLKSYFNNVNVVNGKITDTLRKMWGLEGEYAKKDRSNHIHHCIDAVTVACVEKGTANWISEAFHKYESDYFKGNNNPKYKLKEPMVDFAHRMHNLHKEVFVYHKQIDRIKPLLENLKKEQPKKLNLKGKLNSQTPYAHIKKNDKLIFAQRKSIGSITGKDIENIIDDGIKTRLIALADLKGWEKLMEFQVKGDEDAKEKEMEHKKGIAFRVFDKIKKTDKKKEIVVEGITIETIFSEYSETSEFTNILYDSIIKKDIDIKKSENYKNKIINEVTNLTRTKGLELLLNENKDSEYPAIILPEYFDEKKKKMIGTMVIKRIRLQSSKSNLKDYKEIRAIDKSKFDYKQDYYYDKESYTNYEARIFGDLLPNKEGKFKNRDFKLINHYNIVKNIFEKEEGHLVLKLHQDDMFLIFDKDPLEEVVWNNKLDLQNRLFKIIKFNENGIFVLSRHNYAAGNVDKAKAIKNENNLSDLTEVVLRRSPSTLKIIPAKIDALGNLNINYSLNYIK